MRAKEIAKRYTRVAKNGRKWDAYLSIDHQEFCVCEQTDYRRAKWFAKMLAIALERFLASDSHS